MKFFKKSILPVLTCHVLFFSIILCGFSHTYAQDHKKAELISDNKSKQDITGFVNIAYAWGVQLSPPQNYLRGLINLKDAMHKWTKIQTKIEGHLYLSAPAFLKMPFVYVTSDKSFELSEVEKKNIKEFFDNGGFMVLESSTPGVENNQAEASLKQMVKDVLGSQVKFSPLSKTHSIYHCFFDFDDGPPNGSEISDRNDPVYYLEGIWYKDRLAGVYSAKGYIVKWNEMSNNEPQLKMGVNLIVYALLQNKEFTLSK